VAFAEIDAGVAAMAFAIFSAFVIGAAFDIGLPLVIAGGRD
jgi:hypothetical protein